MALSRYDLSWNVILPVLQRLSSRERAEDEDSWFLAQQWRKSVGSGGVLKYAIHHGVISREYNPEVLLIREKHIVYIQTLLQFQLLEVQEYLLVANPSPHI